MKQNVLTALVAVSLICTGILFYLQFKPAGSTAATGSTEAVKPAEKASYLFVNIDSIVLNYNLAKDKAQFLEQKAREREQKYTSLQNSYASSVKEFQAKQERSTERELQPLITRIQRMQEQLMQMEQQLQQEAMLDQQAINETVMDSLKKVTRDIAAEKKADFVLTVSDMMPVVVHYNPALDITAEAVKRLNASYSGGAGPATVAPQK